MLSRFHPTPRLVAAGLVLAAFLAYAGSFRGPFIFDDLPAIVHNDSVRDLGAPGRVLLPPTEVAGAVGRPVVNLSFALNYAFGGLDVTGYHVANLALHLVAGLLLFAVLRRTLELPALRARWGGDAVAVAGTATLLWLVHPLLTESVTFVTQRNEILVGIFYLLTLYCFIRAVDSPMAGRWHVAAVAACLLGMASKELMVSAPLTVLLYDRTFVSGTFGEALRRRWLLYGGLAATWLLLAGLIFGHAQRAGTVGFGLGVSAWHYLLTQCRAIVQYLGLAFWPHPLVLDYGTDLETSLTAVLPQALLLVTLAILTGVAVWRRRALGLAGFWFFAVLAPSSSFVPLTTQTMAEHRMYLPLLAVIVPVVAAAYRLAGRRGLWWCLPLGCALGWGTWQRNLDYRTVERIWTDTIAKRPDNPRAHLNLGNVAKAAGRLEEAIGRYETALRLKPDYVEARYNLGSALLLHGRTDEGIARLQEALQLSPDYEDARLNLALALARAGRGSEAIPHFERLLPVRPQDAGLRYNLGNALMETNRPAEALVRYEEALRIEPNHAPAHNNLGNALVQLDRAAEAEPHFEAAIRAQPDLVDARLLLGSLRAERGRFAEAAEQFAEALRLKPDDLEACFLYARSLEALGRVTEARALYERALRIEPRFQPAREALTRLPRP